MGVHLLKCAYDNECIKTHDVMCHLICKTFCIHHSWGQFSREMKAMTHVSFSHTQLLFDNVILSKDGVYILINVV